MADGRQRAVVDVVDGGGRFQTGNQFSVGYHNDQYYDLYYY